MDIKWLAMKKLLIQAVEGLNHLHKKGLIHREIAPNKFLIGKDKQGESDLVCKLSDFGFVSKRSSCDDEDTSNLSNIWLAPEILNHPSLVHKSGPQNISFSEPLSFKSNIWSMGWILHFIFTGDPTIVNSIRYKLDHVSVNINLPSIQLNGPLKYFEPLLNKMIYNDAVNRPSLEEVLKTIDEWKPEGDENAAIPSNINYLTFY